MSVPQEISYQLKRIIPELKKSIHAELRTELRTELHAELLKDIQTTITALVKKEIDSQLDAIVSTIVDEKMSVTAKQMSGSIAKSQLAIVKASHNDVKQQMHKDLIHMVKTEIAPKINAFMSDAGEGLQDHTEMISHYRRNVASDHREAAKDAVRTSRNNMLGVKNNNGLRAIKAANNAAGPQDGVVKFLLD